MYGVYVMVELLIVIIMRETRKRDRTQPYNNVAEPKAIKQQLL